MRSRERNGSPFEAETWTALLWGAHSVQDRSSVRSLPLAGEGLRAGQCAWVGPNAVAPGLDWRAPWQRDTRVPYGRTPAGCTLHRYSAVPSTGGGFVLLSQTPGLLRLGMQLLPGGRRRWRYARSLLAGATRLGMARLPATSQVGILECERGSSNRRIADQALAGPIAAIARGVDGAHCKLSILLAEHEDLPQRIVKVSLAPSSREQVRKEARALGEVANASPGAPLPRLLGTGDTGNGTYLVQERLRGKRSPDRIQAQHIDFLTWTAGQEKSRVPIGLDPNFEQDAAYVLRRTGAQSSRWARNLRALTVALRATLGDAPLPRCRAHGDFTPWNLVVAERGILAFDWEYSSPRLYALHDLLHFVTQTGVLVHRESPREILEQAENLFDGIARPLVEQAERRSRGVLTPWAAFGLYLLHAAVQSARRTEIERPSFEQVEWLENAHLTLARQVAERLVAAKHIAATSSAMRRGHKGFAA